MFKTLVFVIVGMLLISCASTNKNLDFSIDKYQNSLISALNYASEFNDLKADNSNNIDSDNLAKLINADLLFNYGDYALAGPIYSTLGLRYQDPKILYKAILCYEFISTFDLKAKVQLNYLIKQLIKLAPNSNLALIFGVQLSLESLNYQEAIKQFNQLSNHNPSKIKDGLIFLSILLSLDLNPKDNNTLEYFSIQIVKKYYKYPESYLLRVVILSLSLNQKELISTFARLNKKYPGFEIPSFFMASLLIRSQKYQLLTQVLSSQLQDLKSPSMAFKNLYVYSLLASQQNTKALNYINQELLKYPASNQWLINLGVVNYELGNLESSLVNFQQAAKENSLNGSIYLVLAGLYDKLNYPLKAKEYYKLAREVNPLLTPAANLGLLRFYLNNQDFKTANYYLESMIKLSNLSTRDNIILYVTIYTELEAYSQAYNYLKPKIKNYKQDKNLVYLYASLAGLSGHTMDAIFWYKKYIRLNPTDPAGYNDLGYILANNTNDYKRAYQLAKKAYQLAPNDAAVLDTIGYISFKLKNYQKAKEYLELAYKLNPVHDNAIHLKQVYLALGQQDLARDVLLPPKKFVQLYLSNSDLNQIMQVLYVYQYGSVLNAK